MIKRILNSVLFSILSAVAYPQTGGDNVFEFLNLTHSGLVSSLGGSNVSIAGKNLNMAYHNPALLCEEMNHNLALNYVNYFAGINYGLAMYSGLLPRSINYAAGITYLNYGSFTAADESGRITGTFSASEYALSLMVSHQIDSLITIGLNFKPVFSHLEKYSSFGFAFDIGTSWHSRNKLVSAGLVVKNAGYQVTSYSGEKRRNLPFEIQTGASIKLAHAPLRFSLTVRHLEKYKLTTRYYSASSSSDAGKNSNDFGENLLRHFIIGAELLPHKNFYLSAGYNYQRRKELQIESKAAMVGFSWGFGINTSFLDIEFGRAAFHVAGSSTNISLVIRPDIMFKKLRNGKLS